jgi:lipoprotein-anchoring transpeptidase ErfK/SrfK
VSLRAWRALVLAAAVLAASLGGVPGIEPRSAGATQFWGVSKVYFDQTGHHLQGDFLTAWQANGGLRTFGYPISDEIWEDGRLVQYFERARFEHWPEHDGTKYVVQASLLGHWVTEGRHGEEPFLPLPDDTDYGTDRQRTFFKATHHSLAYGFKKYWEENGGLYVFGYPISEEFPELNRDTGQVHTVQYFERGRFEWHPEHRGTPYEVLLGRLGAEYADARGIDTSRVPRASDAIGAFAGLLDPNWSRAVRTPSGDVIGVVNVSSLNVRSQPSLNATIVGTKYERHTIVIKRLVGGDAVGDIPAWYEIGPNQFVAAVYVSPFIATPPPKTYSGRWLDVNLSTFYAVAYEGNTPVYAAIITAGRDNRTPVGEFSIFSRVRSERMDSATVGIPPGHPEYYLLENVQFTQYFRSGGYALHENYWSHPSAFGRFSSNGCVGVMTHDAEWFWNFLGIGSRVHIHY